MEACIADRDSFVPSELYEIAAQIATSHQITAYERCMLRTAFLEHPLNEEEHRLVNRLYRALLRGRLQLV